MWHGTYLESLSTFACGGLLVWKSYDLMVSYGKGKALGFEKIQLMVADGAGNWGIKKKD